MTRRAVLRDGSVVALAVLASGPVSAFGNVAVAITSGGPKFLTEDEMEALRGLVDRFIPGRPEDTDEGALAGGCAEAIDALLGAFRVDPPMIYAGAPFSDRAGSPVNHFERFLKLDPYETKAWRLRIEGSKGRPKLEFNGPVKGWQQIYREGLAALERRRRRRLRHAAGPGARRDPALVERPRHRRARRRRIPAHVRVHVRRPGVRRQQRPDRLAIHQLRRRRAAARLDPGADRAAGLRRRRRSAGGFAVDAPRDADRARPPASPELAHGIVARSGGTLSGLRSELAPVLAFLERDGADGA